MIDNELLQAYMAELEALRVHGRDFAADYPDIASRLDIGSRRSRDPHVERVVESAAFLAARLRLMIDSRATELPLAMLLVAAPSLVEPVPAMAVMALSGGTDIRRIPRGTRFDAMLAGNTPVCFSTTMDILVAPYALHSRRLAPDANTADGIAVRVVGRAPRSILMCVGSNERSAAVLMDAFDESLASIHVVPPNGLDPIRIPVRALRVHGFSDDEAALPVRPATHQAHRVVTEFMVFPGKFRFLSLTDIPIAPGSEIHFRFNAPLALPTATPAEGLITANRVPTINLWQSAGSPIDVNGRQLEYPVKVDALRYRTVECHSVESVDLYVSGQPRPQRLDPVVALGEIRGTDVRWGVRRNVTKTGGEVLLYFDGLDYTTLGRQRMLATPSVRASNRDFTQYVRTGASVVPVEGLGNWRGAMTSVPTPFHEGLSGTDAMETMIGYLHSNAVGLSAEAGHGALTGYLKRFPGGRQAAWIDGIGRAAHRAVTALRQGQPQPGTAIAINFDSGSYPTTSRAMVKRVLGQLFESQRGLNRVEEVVING